MVDKIHEIIDKHSELFSHGKPEIYSAFKTIENVDESKAIHKLNLKKINSISEHSQPYYKQISRTFKL